MIIGIGSDLIDIRRIARTLERFGQRFERRVYSDQERAKANRRATKAGTYAKRFAAKEACAKALGTGVPRRGVHWRSMDVVNLPGGKPAMALSGGAARRLEALLPAGMEARIDVSLTDDYPLAQAIVIISAIPRQGGEGPDSGRPSGGAA
ncbi:MAG: holo-ACP synthase [Rhodospirillales bacterium]|nr:holo-ACP synthase [Rhodospirillales bacterium]